MSWQPSCPLSLPPFHIWLLTLSQFVWNEAEVEPAEFCVRTAGSSPSYPPNPRQISVRMERTRLEQESVIRLRLRGGGVKEKRSSYHRVMGAKSQAAFCQGV